MELCQYKRLILSKQKHNHDYMKVIVRSNHISFHTAYHRKSCALDLYSCAPTEAMLQTLTHIKPTVKKRTANFNTFNSSLISHPRESEPVPADGAHDAGDTLHRAAFHHRVDIKTQVVPHPVEMATVPFSFLQLTHDCRQAATQTLL